MFYTPIGCNLGNLYVTSLGANYREKGFICITPRFLFEDMKIKKEV